MSSMDERYHRRWYLICPELPFSLFGNLLITLLFIVFIPVILAIGPQCYIIYSFYHKIFRKFVDYRYCATECSIKQVLCWLFIILFVLPIIIACSYVPSLLFAPVAIVPLYYYSIAHFIRLLVVICRTKL